MFANYTAARGAVSSQQDYASNRNEQSNSIFVDVNVESSLKVELNRKYFDKNSRNKTRQNIEGWRKSIGSVNGVFRG